MEDLKKYKVNINFNYRLSSEESWVAYLIYIKYDLVEILVCKHFHIGVNTYCIVEMYGVICKDIGFVAISKTFYDYWCLSQIFYAKVLTILQIMFPYVFPGYSDAFDKHVQYSVSWQKIF